MKVRTKTFRAVAICLSLSVAVAVLVLSGGCGAGAPDEATKAKMYELDAKVKEVHAKKRLPESSASPVRKKR